MRATFGEFLKEKYTIWQLFLLLHVKTGGFRLEQIFEIVRCLGNKINCFTNCIMFEINTRYWFFVIVIDLTWSKNEMAWTQNNCFDIFYNTTVKYRVGQGNGKIWNNSPNNTSAGRKRESKEIFIRFLWRCYRESFKTSTHHLVDIFQTWDFF